MKKFPLIAILAITLCISPLAIAKPQANDIVAEAEGFVSYIIGSITDAFADAVDVVFDFATTENNTPRVNGQVLPIDDEDPIGTAEAIPTTDPMG